MLDDRTDADTDIDAANYPFVEQQRQVLRMAVLGRLVSHR